MEVDKQAESSVLTISNILLVIMVIKEISLIFFLFLFNFFSTGLMCGVMFLLGIIYLVIYIFGGVLTVQMFRSGEKGSKEKKGWTAAAVVMVLGLTMIVTPFFPFVITVSMYIFTYQLIEENKKLKFTLSVFLYLGASFVTFIGFLLGGLTNVWVLAGLFVINSVLFIISHTQHISLNKRCITLLNDRSKRGYVQSPASFRMSQPPRPDYSFTRNPAMPRENVPKRVMEKPVVKKEDAKPRVLEAPPGYE